jgi:hypothetical protein
MSGGRLLKVGIATNLRRRLRNHAASRQNALRLKPGGKHSNPDHVVSKSSILAKHLYYDANLTRAHDLTTENGRRMFLTQRCVVRFTKSRDLARIQEREMERSVAYRYRGRVVVRSR